MKQERLYEGNSKTAKLELRSGGTLTPPSADYETRFGFSVLDVALRTHDSIEARACLTRGPRHLSRLGGTPAGGLGAALATAATAAEAAAAAASVEARGVGAAPSLVWCDGSDVGGAGWSLRCSVDSAAVLSVGLVLR